MRSIEPMRRIGRQGLPPSLANRRRFNNASS